MSKMRNGKWRTERVGVHWLCKGIKAKVIDYNPDERDGDAIILVDGQNIYVDCVTTYDFNVEKLKFPVGIQAIDYARSTSIDRIMERARNKIKKRYADNRSLLIIVDDPCVVGRLTLRAVANRLKCMDFKLYNKVYMVEILTRVAICIK